MLSFCRAHGFALKLPAGTERCFYEVLEKDQKMGVTFEVGSGGHLDIDFKVRGLPGAFAFSSAAHASNVRCAQIFEPTGRVLFAGNRESSETYTFVAELAGRYEYCFSNEMSSVTEKGITFSVVADSASGSQRSASGAAL